MSNLSPDQASRILNADFMNLVHKVRRGVTLTQAERLLIKARSIGDEGGDLSVTSAITVVELAEALGVSRRSISNWRKLDGSPQAASNGSHDVVAWREFITKRGLKADSGESEEILRYRKLTAEVEEREFRLAVRKGNYVLRDTVRQSWLERAGRVTAILRAKYEKELPPLLIGLDAPSIAEMLAESLDEALTELHKGGGKSLTP